MPDIETIVAEGIQPMFSADAIRYGDLLFVSGCVPMDAEGNVVHAGDLEAQCRKVLDNMRIVLEAAGTGFEHVLKTTVYLRDISQRGVTHSIRAEIFGDRPPASTIVEVAGLSGDDVGIEIDAIAAIPS